VYTVNPEFRANSPSTGDASTQVGQSRLTTATKPSRGRSSGIASPARCSHARMNRLDAGGKHRGNTADSSGIFVFSEENGLTLCYKLS
jgi:hypothetical protein